MAAAVYKTYCEVVAPNGKTRFSSIRKHEAVTFAQLLFKSEGIECDVLEHDRSDRNLNPKLN